MPRPDAETRRYAILEGGAAIQCLTCLKISRHPRDVAERYCGRCHAFHADDERFKLEEETLP